MLKSGELEFAIVQSDRQRDAYEGSKHFQKLRSVMSLYPEMVTILTRRDPTIKGAMDLLGKRVDIGLPGSGRNATVRELLRRLDVDFAAFANVQEYSPTTAVEELCEGRLDATILVIGHPNELVAGALSRCDLVILPFRGERALKFAERASDYMRDALSGNAYPELDGKIETLAVRATLVTSSDTEDELVTALVKSVLDNLPSLARRSNLLADPYTKNCPHQRVNCSAAPGRRKGVFRAINV